MKKLLTYIGILLFVGNSAQTISPSGVTSTENYIYSRSYLEGVSSSSSSAKQIQGITYFDGLGRPKQSIAIKTTPAGKDMVTPIEYDGFGRQVKDWLPLPQTTTGDGAINTNPDTSFYISFTGANLYSEKKLELSPLDRLQEQGHPGTDWNIGSTHSQKFEYDANGDHEVKKYTATFNYTTFTSNISLAPSTDTNANNGFYKTAQLYKNKVTDEDGNVSYEYKNGQGQTILVRKYDGTANVDTYYVYNDYDQLAFVISPLASDKYKNSAAGTSVSSTDLDQLCYQYKYDSKNRLVEKKLPGKGWEYMVYDNKDRLVATQDANLRTQGKWLFTKYDQFGRVAYTGIFSGSSRTAEQSAAEAAGANNTERKTAVSFTQNGMGVYYGNPSAGSTYPSSITTLLSVNYYDTYPAFTPTMPSRIQGQLRLTDGLYADKKTKGLPTATCTKNIENDSWTKSFTFYDAKARVICTNTQNHLGGYTKTEVNLKFSGKPTEIYTYHKRTAADNETLIRETFGYDFQDRLLTHSHQVNNAPEELLSKNIYNELGQLQKKNVGNTQDAPLQKIKYEYNIRGWLTDINNTDVPGDDLFTFRLKYSTPLNNSVAKACYNGNISEADWRTPSDGKLRRYIYLYDGLNRLTDAKFRTPLAASPETDFYNESLTYDLNGNIKTLDRYSKNESVTGSSAQKIDELAYTYTGNQLLQVNDFSGNYSGYPGGGNTITYDANGNMTSQLDKNISSIQYNFLNLPNQVMQSGGNTGYVYRADGLKVKKTYGTKITDYLDGFQYENNTLQFVPTAEGYYDFANSRYTYNYVDHLGNVRVSYYKNSAGVLTTLEESNYYPFGLKHEGYNALAGNNAYKYKYNGKELQETGMYDYGARFYMPDIGRWGVPDPLAEEFPSWTPYNYVYNNPLKFIDPDGKAAFPPDDYIFDQNGKFVRIDKNKSPDRLVIENSQTGARQNYLFSDPVNDPQEIKYGVINKVVFVSKSRIENMLEKQGAFDPQNKDSLINFYKESKGGHKFDYSYSVIPSEFSSEGASSNPLTNRSPMLFLPEGENTVQNHMNFGNFLWAATGKTLGFSYATLQLAAHANSLINSKSNGYPAQLDSADDQHSIIQGAYYSEKNNLRQILIQHAQQNQQNNGR